MSAELYHERIVALARDASGARRLEAPDATATVDNPLCGDRVTIDLRVAAGRVSEVGHRVRGCLLCEAAAALIAAAAPGRTGEEARAGAAAARAVLAGDGDPPAGAWSDVSVFRPVRDFRSRHECVLLPFEALDRALRDLSM